MLEATGSAQASCHIANSRSRHQQRWDIPLFHRELRLRESLRRGANCPHEQSTNTARTSAPAQIPAPQFVHLKVHSAYSLLEGAITIPRLAKLAVGQRLSRARPHRHQQPVRRAGVLRQAGRCRHTADRRLHAAGRFRRPAAGQRPGARRRQSSALPARRRAGPAREQRDGLPEPDEACLARLLRSGRGRGPAHPDRAAGNMGRGADRADRRPRRAHRQGAARGSEGSGVRAAEGAGEDFRRPAVRRDPAPRPEARDRDRAGAARPRLCARAADRRHQRGLFRLARRLRGARRAAVHRRGQLRRRGRPPAAVARALLQDRRADGRAVRRPARGARQHDRDRQALRLPARGTQADPAALRQGRRRMRAKPSCSSSRRPSCARRPKPA